MHGTGALCPVLHIPEHVDPDAPATSPSPPPQAARAPPVRPGPELAAQHGGLGGAHPRHHRPPRQLRCQVHTGRWTTQIHVLFMYCIIYMHMYRNTSGKNRQDSLQYRDKLLFIQKNKNRNTKVPCCAALRDKLIFYMSSCPFCLLFYRC
jgi:hypothetical protein